MPRQTYKTKLVAPAQKIVRQFVWQDPFPEIPGTKPEKMVYAELMRRGIPFQFQEWFHVSVPIETAQWLRPDFSIPSAKIIIAVQGTYFHSQAATIAKDSLQFAVYEMMGWLVLPWWEYDIESRLQDLFESVPQLVAIQNTGTALPHVAKWYNDLAGLKKKNQERRKPWTKKAVVVTIKGKRPRKKQALKGIFQ